MGPGVCDATCVNNDATCVKYGLTYVKCDATRVKCDATGFISVGLFDDRCLKRCTVIFFIHSPFAADLYGELHFDPDQFCITSLVHPTTYLNKIVLGSRQGTLQLWNIRTRWVGSGGCGQTSGAM